MDQFPVYRANLLPRHEQFLSGRRSCKGCGKALSCRIVSKALDGAVESTHNQALTGCALDVQTEQSLEQLLDRRSSSGKKPKGIIGINRTVFSEQYLALTGLLESSDAKAVYVCLDNEPYIDELIQQTAPLPFGLNEKYSEPATEKEIQELVHHKNIPPIVRQGYFSYFATACPGFPLDLMDKLKKAYAADGNAFILVLTPCPTGWIFPPADSIAMGARAVLSRWLPLFEFCEGTVTISKKITNKEPARTFLSKQKRFFTLPDTVYPALQHAVDSFYDRLNKNETELFT